MENDEFRTVSGKCCFCGETITCEQPISYRVFCITCPLEYHRNHKCYHDNTEKACCSECYEIITKEINELSKNGVKQSVINNITYPQVRLFYALRKIGLEPELECEVEFKKKDAKGIKHIDIALPRYSIYIEVNGNVHTENTEQQRKDLWRTYFAAVDENFLTLNIFNSTIENDEDLEKTADTIKRIAKEHKEYLQKKGDECKDCPQKKKTNATQTA